MKRLKKMPKLEGRVPYFYSADVIHKMCITINALAEGIDYLAEKVEELEKRSDNNEKDCSV